MVHGVNLAARPPRGLSSDPELARKTAVIATDWAPLDKRRRLMQNPALSRNRGLG